MPLNDPAFVGEFREHVSGLGIRRILEVGALSGELMDAVGAEGIDLAPKRPDVIRADVRAWRPGVQYDLVFSSGVLEHYPPEEAVDLLRAMAILSTRWILTYVPNSRCAAYLQAKRGWPEPLRSELAYTLEDLADLHDRAGLQVREGGEAAREWARRFDQAETRGYLVWVLAEVPGSGRRACPVACG